MSNILKITDRDYDIFYSNDTNNMLAFRLCLSHYLHELKLITDYYDKIKGAEQIFIILDTPCGHTILKTDFIFRNVVIYKIDELLNRLHIYQHNDINNILSILIKIKPIFTNLHQLNIDYNNYTWLYKLQIRV